MTKLYAVRGSEDGIIGIATSAGKAARMALVYVSQDRPETRPRIEAARRTMIRELNRDGVVEITTAQLLDSAACSDCVSAEIQRWDANYTCGIGF